MDKKYMAVGSSMLILKLLEQQDIRLDIIHGKQRLHPARDGGYGIDTDSVPVDMAA